MALPFLILANPKAWQRAPELAYGQGGYQPGGTHKTLSAAIALGAAALVVAGLATALVAPDILTHTPRTIEVTNYTVPEPQVIPDEPSPPVDTNLTAPKPIINIPTVTAEPPHIIIDPPVLTGPVIIPSSGGTGIEPVTPPVAEPVLRAATRNNRYMNAFQPPYPASRQREGIEGRCTVRVTIAPTGRVTEVQNVACPDSAFFDATQRRALSSWRFNPATRDGVAVESSLTQTVVFEIRE